jgi:ferredoxin
MREHAWQIRQGIDVLCHLLQPKHIIIGIENNKPEAIEAMQVACRENPNYRVCVIPTKYPAGGEKQLIQVLTNREVPAQGLPVDVGVIMHNVGTCFAIADAIFSGKPLIQRVVTITGEAVEKPCNLWAMIGTPIADLMAHGAYQSAKQQRPNIIMGGPMMGFSVASDLVPVIKTTNCILLPTDKEIAGNNEQPCIRCGACADVCPASLLPQQLFWHAKGKELDKAQEYNLFDCIECGACAYVCPSEIPLVHYYRIAKSEIRVEQEEKQKIVLMSIILLAFIKKQAHTLRKDVTAYHNPLLLTLVNSVSAEDSDLYLFFKELNKIATNKFSKKLFEESKRILQKDLYDNLFTEFEKEEVLSYIEISSIRDLTIEDVWHYVFNTKSSGEFEVKRNPKDNQELSFRVKSGAHSEPFALIKIGNVKAFEKNNLGSYDIEEDFDNESIFENLDNSSVNILMGSRAFYEGWDSNRPNIINFVNIGTQSEAKKFILQSVGRGIRIEPIKNNRKRLLPLINDGIEIEEELSMKSKDVKPLETLFVFGTNQKAILSVLETLKGVFHTLRKQNYF